MQARTFLAFGVILGLTTTTALSDDWTVTRLRGGVFALTDGQWEQLHRGSVVSDDRVIKSAPNSRATFVRDLETVELGPETTAQIADAGDFTTVYNHAGTVGVEAEARNVQHFAVETPFLAAVVKGTAFVVQSDEVQSKVAVTRGTVQVNDAGYGSSVSLGAGQEVASSSERPISPAVVVPVTGTIPKPPPPAVPPPPAAAETTVYVPGVTEPPVAQETFSSLSDSDGADDGESPDGFRQNSPGEDRPGQGQGSENGSAHDGGNGNGNSKGDDNGSGQSSGNGKGNNGKGNDNGKGNGNGAGKGSGNGGGKGDGNGAGKGNGSGEGKGSGNGQGKGDGNENSDSKGKGKGNGKGG